MRRIFPFLLALPLLAGDGVTITSTQELSSSSVPARGANAACRAEVSVRDWDATPATGAMASPYMCGLKWEFNTVNYFQFYGQRQTGVINSTTGDSSPILIPISLFVEKFAFARLQLFPDGAGGTGTVEVWDSTMTRVAYEYFTYTGTTGSNSNGFLLEPPGNETMTFDSFKVFSTTVSVGSRPPVYWESADILDLKFDSALTDSSGNGYDAALNTGSPSYDATPYQDVIKATACMDGAPDWTCWISGRTGHAFTLDGTASAHWGDSQGSESFAWSFTAKPSGAPDPTFGTASASTTTVSDHVWGGYTFRLTYGSTGFSSVTNDLAMGVVSYDSNGVVSNVSQDVLDLVGPMIAFGQNPWQYADERAVAGSRIRHTQLGTVHEFEPYNSSSWLAPSWNTPQTGTVTYTFNGLGVSAGGTGTTLSAGINATDTSIPITNASVLQLTNLPTRIFIRSGTTQEEIRICSTTGTTGAQTLTACFDGRGWDEGTSGFSFSAGQIAAQAWSSGATVGQFEVVGSGTDFINTGEDGMCYAAGPSGPMRYNTGTVDPAPGSTSLTGSGTTWTSLPALDGTWKYYIRIEGTHSTGTPFVFVSPITITGDTAITLNRAYPAAADDGSGLTYQIIYPFLRRIALHFDRDDLLAMGDDPDVMQAYYVTGCESDTQLFINWAQSQPSVANVNGVIQSAKEWSFIDNSSYVNSNGLGSANFYCETCANYVTWLRSGATEFLTAARALAWDWPYYPPLHGGTDGSLGALTHTIGGGVVGSIMCLVVDPDCPFDWSLVRGYAVNGETQASATCYAFDTRDDGYKLAWLALAARFDPDATFKARWQAALQDFYAKDLTCAGADYTFKNTAYFGTSGRPQVTLSGTTVSGTGLTSTYCKGVDSGLTVSVTNGSASITVTSGTLTAGVDSIVLHGTKDGSPYNVFVSLTRSTSTTGSLGMLWPGDSGSLSAMSADSNGNDLVVFGESSTDADLEDHYLCKYVSSTEWTLDRAWEGAGGTHYAYGPENDLGKMQQWFMVLGVKMSALRWAALSDAAIGGSQDYAGLAQLTAANITAAYDANTKGIQYNTSNLAPLPYTAAGSFTYTHPGFTYGLASPGEARTLNGEAAPTLIPYLQASNYSSAAKSFGDTFYGAVFGVCSLTTGGAFCDDTTIDALTDNSMDAGKWFGFFFGMGMAHQWPAVRNLSAPTVGVTITGDPIITGNPTF